MSQSNPFLASAPTPPGGDPGNGRTVGADRGWAWIAEGFELFKKEPGLWVGMFLVLFVIAAVMSVIPVLGSIGLCLLMPVFAGGLMLACRHQQRGGALEFAYLFAGFKTQTGQLVTLGGFTLLGWIIILIPVIAIVGVGAFMGAGRGDATGIGAIGGSFALGMLLLFALSILVYMALWFAPALVALREVAPIAALKQSFTACLNNFVPFLIYGLVVLVLSILATIPFGLGWLVLGPVLIASIYTAYRDIYGGD